MTPVRLGDVADVIRSKNAGPHAITFDVMFEDPGTYRHVRDHTDLSRDAMARLFGVSVDDITYCDFFAPAQAFKLTILRRAARQGSVGETDTFGCQQHAPLLTVAVPDWPPEHSHASGNADAHTDKPSSGRPG